MRERLVLHSGGPEQTFERGPNGWTQCLLANGPLLPAHRLAFDHQRKVLVGVDELGTAWDWDGVVWNPHPVLLQPPVGSNRDNWLVYDGATREILLLVWPPNNPAEYWTWNGSRWWQRHPAHTPQSTSWFAVAVASDLHRRRVVLHEGMAGETWEWDGVDWSLVATNGPGNRSYLVASHDSHRQRTMFLGGIGASGVLREVWEWDGATWTQAPQLPALFQPASAAFDESRNTTSVVGAVDLHSLQIAEYDGQTWQLQPMDPVSGQWTGIVADASSQRARLLVASPVATGAPIDEYEWATTYWRAVPSAVPLPWRAYSGVACDRLRGNLVVFGGETLSTLTNQTWLGANGSWQPAPLTGAAPSPRMHPAMAWDGARNSILLFGGTDQTQVLGDTWTWNGASWQALATPIAPGPRYMAAITELESPSQVLLWGGYGPNNTVQTDGWYWDGLTWSPFPVGNLPPIQPHGLVQKGSDLFLYGYNPASASEQTWSASRNAPSLYWYRIDERPATGVHPAVLDATDGFFVSLQHTMSLSEGRVSAVAAGCPQGGPSLVATGVPRSGASLRLEVHGAAADSFGILVFGTVPGPVSLPGGCLLAMANATAATTWFANSGGFAGTAMSLAPGMPTHGWTIFVQAVGLDSNAAGGFVMSQGLLLAPGD